MSRPSKVRSVLFDPSGRCQAVMSRRPYNTQADVNWAIKDWPGLEPPTANILWGCACWQVKHQRRGLPTERQTNIWVKPKLQEILPWMWSAVCYLVVIRSVYGSVAFSVEKYSYCLPIPLPLYITKGIESCVKFGINIISWRYISHWAFGVHFFYT
jgi:hypothetical protein